jgi:uncharacterized phosphosugar-binding protein
MIQRYLHAATTALTAAAAVEAEAIDAAAALIATSIISDGVLHVFGSGHSQLVAKEIVGRSGSLIPVNEIIDRTEDLAERIEGYGTRLVEYYAEQYQLRRGEAVIVISNSGVNPLPVEVALSCREHGLSVIVITNVQQSEQARSRHSSGKRLFELADVVLHNHAPEGEAALELPGLDTKVGTIATLTGAFLINAVMARTAERLLADGHEPPVYLSENHARPDAARHNSDLRARYQGRLRRFGA